MKPSALILIDVQKGFNDTFWGVRNNLDAELRMQDLLDHWRDKDWPVIHVQHLSLEDGSPLHQSSAGIDFQDFAKPKDWEPVFTKHVNSAFIGTGLEEHLKSAGINDLVIVGLTTDHCVSTSTRMAGNLGFNVTLVSDATATFDRKNHDGTHFTADEIHNIHLASLNEEFCVVKTTQWVLSEAE